MATSGNPSPLPNPSGFLDWQQLETQRHCVRQLAEDATTLDSDAATATVAQHLATVLAADLALAAQRLIHTAADPQHRWQRLQQLLPHLAHLRREDHRGQAVQLALRREDRRHAEAGARQAQSLLRTELAGAAEDELISALYASSDPALKALAVRLSEHALAHRPALAGPPASAARELV